MVHPEHKSLSFPQIKIIHTLDGGERNKMKIDEKVLITLLSENDDFLQIELATIFNVSQTSISQKLKKLGLKNQPIDKNGNALKCGAPKKPPVICKKCKKIREHQAKGLCACCYNKEWLKNHMITETEYLKKLREKRAYDKAIKLGYDKNFAEVFAFNGILLDNELKKRGVKLNGL